MTTHVTKTWIQDGKLITEIFEEKEIYKREWVGLTEDEIGDLFGDWPFKYGEFARAIEAKLKEKNT